MKTVERKSQLLRQRMRMMLLFIVWIGLGIWTASEASASASGLQLSFYANHNGNLDGGHCWLDVTNQTGHDVIIGEYILPSGKTTYIGARGESALGGSVAEGNLKGGAFFNYESVVHERYVSYAKYSVEIQESDLPKIYEHMRKFGTYYLDVNNCTTFAYNTWNDVVPENQRISKNFFEDVIDQPFWAKKHLVDDFGASVYYSLPDYGYQDEDVLLVSPGGHLQPYFGKTGIVGDLSGAADSCNSISLKWSSCLKKIGVHDYNLTGYEICWYEAGKPGKEKKVRVDKPSALSYRITGLKPDTKYNCKVRTINDQKDHWYIGVGSGIEVWVTTPKYSIALNKGNASVYKGLTDTLTAKLTCVTTESITSSNLTWKSSNSKIVSVKNGKITAIKPGKATITAVFRNTAKAVCKVTVLKPKIVMAKSKTIYQGLTAKLLATVYGKSKKITWSSSNKKVATVSGGKIKAVGKGKAKITAKANGVKAVCTVTVKKPEIRLSKSSLDMTKGSSSKLTATILGKKSKIKWKSNKPSVVTVDKNGELKAKKKGIAIITASANGASAKCKVTVTNYTLNYASPTIIDETSFSVSECTSSNAYVTPTLLLDTVKGNTITFRMSYYVYYSNAFWTHLVTDTIKANVVNGKVSGIKWHDQYGNAGTLSMVLKPGYTVELALTTSVFASDPYRRCYLKQYKGILSSVKSEWSTYTNDELIRW